MAHKTDSRHQIKQMAQVLNIPERELSYLNSLSVSEVSHLYEQVEGSVSGAQSPLWPALAKSVRFFPNRVCAKITQEALGPYIAAQMTRHLDTKTAVGIGKHFTPQFLAEVLGYIDPAESTTLLAKLPMSSIKKGVMFLLAEQKFDALGTLVQYLPKDRTLSLIKEIESPKSLVRIANACEDKERMADIVVQLKDEELYGIIDAASELELWEPVLMICSHMSSRQQLRMATLAGEFEWDDLDYFSELATHLGLTDRLAVLLNGEINKESPLSLGKFLPWKVKGF